MQLLALKDIPSIGPDSDLAAEISVAMQRAGLTFEANDILVVAQKIVSKAENQFRRLGDFVPSDRAQELARQVRKDPRYVEAVLSESRMVIRAAPDVLIVEHRLGHVMANAGIDQSNTGKDDEHVLLLPEDPDRSARALRDRLCPEGAAKIGVVISDSFGRPWRVGTTGVAIGIAGLPAVIDRRGEQDRFGRVLRATEIGFADAVAAAAVLVMGEGDEGVPAVILRGLAWNESDHSAAAGLRDPGKDLFR